MTEHKQYTLKEIDNFDCGLQVTDVILDKDNGIELPQSTVCDLLNNKDERIKELEQEVETLQDQLAHEEQRIEALESGFEKDLKAMYNDCMKCEKRYQELIKELEKENNALKEIKKEITYESKDECIYEW